MLAALQQLRTAWRAIVAAEKIRSCRSIEEFYQACAPLGLYTSGRRFLHLELDIVNKCNLRCVMCYHSLEATRRARTVYLSPEDFGRVAARLLPHAHRLSLSLGNEPLMSPHFESILRIVAPYQVPNINFFTNGLLLNERNIDAIVESGVTQVCISVDGATRETYNAIRRDGDFDQLLQKVKLLVQRRDAAGSATPRLRFDVVLMRRNICEMVDLVKLAAQLGVQDLSFRHMVAFEGLAMEPQSLTHSKALSDYWLDYALATAARLGLQIQSRPAFFVPAPAEKSAAFSAAGTPYLPTPYCPYPFFHVTMGPGGHVLPCPHSHGESPYGQVTADTPIDHIWLGPKFTLLRERILRHDPPDMCRRCPYLADRHPNVAGLFATRKH
jgi:MoaA/NifB/PqqE/SkfB family radical SAM enzyme